MGEDFRSLIAVIILSLCLCQISYAVYPDDRVYFPSLNQTYYLANETYTFNLVPSFFVPLNVKLHVIYTASSASLTKIAKRVIFEKRHALYDFSENDHERLANFLYGNEAEKVPPFIRVNKRKRSLDVTSEGVGSIPLAEGVSLIHFGDDNNNGNMKRTSIPIGTKFCLSIPAFTTCPDDGGTQQIKDAITGSVNEIRTELDSYTATNNLREQTLSSTLTKQQALIAELLTLTNSATELVISEMIEHESINAVNMAHGDYVAQAQINYLKRVTDSLLQYLRSMASTDPRAVVSQPSLSQLFISYQAILSYLNSNNLIPIVDSNTFNWTEVPLPSDVSTHTAWPPLSSVLWDSSQPRAYRGMTVYIQGYACDIDADVMDTNLCLQNSNPQLNCKCMNDQLHLDNMALAPTNSFYGPLPQGLTGLYTVAANATLPVRNIVYQAFPFTDDTVKGDRVDQSNPPALKNWYCIQFGAYLGLADFSSTPNMVNGVPPNYPAVNNSDCDPLRLRSATGNTIYSLYAVKESVIIPFYSNCTAKQLINLGVITTASKLGYYSQYPQGYDYTSNSTFLYGSSGYASQGVGSLPADPTASSLDLLTNTDMYQYNMISANCAMNLNPEWIGGTYYTKNSSLVISNIPTGFKFDQFTINPYGELSSSLQFVYTTQWVQTYLITRVSENSMITDEVDVLDGTTVLFYVNNNASTVIDAGDYFFGEGNNGRDCIRKTANYSFDLTTCLYQNDLLQYGADNYFLGLQKTTGVARFIDKYSFTFKTTAGVGGAQPQYSFSLVTESQNDYQFYIQSDGTVCPKLVNQESSTDSCTFTFVYYGSYSVTFANKPVVFDSQQMAVVTTPQGLQRLVIGSNQECMLINCKFTQSYSVVQLEPPPYTLIQASDLALQTEIFYTFDKSVNGTLQLLQSAADQSTALYQQNLQLQKQLAAINYTYFLLNEYQNFSDLRAQVDAYINAISPVQPDYSFAFDCGDGIFGSIGCFFSNLFTTIITILIVAAIFIGIYIVCFKLGVAKIITKKLIGGKK